MNDERRQELIVEYPILRFFSYEHLPEELQPTSRYHAELAFVMADEQPRNPETSAGLRHLLEAKDCFVRAALK